MIDQIIQCIRETKFEQAYLLMHTMPLEKKWDIISNDLYDEEPAIIYAFLMYLIAIDNNEAEWHYFCCSYLIYCHPFFDDSMRLAAWHIKQALRLSPTNIDYKEQVISVFYSFPEWYFSFEDFYQYAEDVLKIEPDNLDAKNILLEKSKTVKD